MAQDGANDAGFVPKGVETTATRCHKTATREKKVNQGKKRVGGN
tara:strand:- start:4002 stop:4133 length:132 start_codon:yes stop_codon:yes gene_type:complete